MTAYITPPLSGGRPSNPPPGRQQCASNLPPGAGDKSQQVGKKQGGYKVQVVVHVIFLPA